MTFRQRCFIIFTFIIALILDILPIPGWGIWLRPNWTLLIMIYWVMVVPYRFSIGTAFILGLLLDMLNGAVLGQNAFCFVIIAYITAKTHKRLWLAPVPQQLFAILFLITLYKAMIFAIQMGLGQAPGSRLYWTAIVVDIIVWIWVFLILSEWQRRLRIGAAQ